MKIESTPTLVTLEDAILESLAPSDDRLRLPIKPRANSLGVEASLLQTIVTWARNHADGSLELHLSDDESTRAFQLETFVRKQPGGLVASAMTRRVFSVGSSSSVEVDTLIEQHLEAFRNPPNRDGQLDLFDTERSDWSESRIPAMGPKLFLPCLDHFEDGRIPHLYVDNQTLRTRIEFNALVQTLLRRLANTSAFAADRKNPFSAALMNGISRIVYELFDNTHKWAVDDSSGRELDTSARGILLRLHPPMGHEVESADHENVPLKKYFSNDRMRERSVRIIEISIFDSGPGLAARKLRRALTADDSTKTELFAVCDCFRKHSTTSNQSGRGLGLHYLMDTLTELNGFLRLRSGRLCLYRDLIDHPVDSREGWLNTALHDWHGQREEPTSLSKVEGALFTILLPLI